jgi:pyruvate formate lyase activating enzyme
MSNNSKIKIGGLQKLTLIDFPGKLAATVFLSGCNFRCPFCYSSELVLPEKIKNQPRISEKEFFAFLKERKGMLEGVVICGGEPTINKQLPQFCQKIKKLGFLVKLDTNGSNPKMLKKLIDEKLVDYVAMDIKAPLGKNFQFSISNFQTNSESQIPKYEIATGVKAETDKIKESIKLIKNSDVDYEFRTTVVPGIHQKEDILQIARDISPAKKYFLQNFKPGKNINPVFEKVESYSPEFLLNLQKAISPFFDVCQVR